MYYEEDFAPVLRRLSGVIEDCSREFIGFLKKLDAAYPCDTAIRVILDNHSAHISKETNKWLAAQPEGRFSFVFTPKHGSWLNLIENQFSKMTRTMLPGIRVASKQELIDGIHQYFQEINADPASFGGSPKWTRPLLYR